MLGVIDMIDVPRVISIVVRRMVVDPMSTVRAMIPAGARVVNVVTHQTVS
jgi:hypothetical protein